MGHRTDGNIFRHLRFSQHAARLEVHPVTDAAVGYLDIALQLATAADGGLAAQDATGPDNGVVTHLHTGINIGLIRINQSYPGQHQLQVDPLP